MKPGGVGFAGDIVIVADRAAHNQPILLLHPGMVIFSVTAGAALLAREAVVGGRAEFDD